MLIKAIFDPLRDEMWDKRPIKNEFCKKHFCIEFDFNVIQFIKYVSKLALNGKYE